MNPGKTVLPLIPLKEAVILPHSIAPIFVGRELSLQAVEAALQDDKLIVIATQRDSAVEIPQKDDLYTIGTKARILQVMRMTSAVKVLVEGLQRVAITQASYEDGFLRARFTELTDSGSYNPVNLQGLWRALAALYKKYTVINPKTPLPSEILGPIKSVDEIAGAVDTLAIHCNLTLSERQEILEIASLQDRLLHLSTLLQREIDIVETEKRINSHVQIQVERNQREYYLHEQLKAINKELGRDDHADIHALREKAASLNLPAEAAEKVASELKRLEQIPPLSPESGVSRNYIDWIFALPWHRQSRDTVSLAQAEKILDNEHAGLKKPKERILEFLAAKKFNPDLRYSPTICLMGPPGVGKTSLARSIAHALDREFIRISLGGVRDEAEIRGHRRTYIGALPGKLLQAMRKAKTINPVILLDEIDKITTDYHGDPSSALLEVLDPEQNRSFCDNYLEIGYDLSKVMFIATANMPDGIPYPLFDRMEMITLSGYTDAEKLEIAQKFLIPKHIKEHGLTSRRCKFAPGVLTQIITHYTKEAGVRNLERTIAKLIRKTVQHIMHNDNKGSVTITEARCLEWLGPAPFKKKNVDATMNIGCATGLAWTELGGDILDIETTTVPGKGELTLTGQLGDVMQESAQAALSYVRSRAEEFGIKKAFFASHDIHVHIPEGATPKDGPSAGITMCTALVSALTSIPIKPAIAMTGEVTLRGRVLPVGGLKEKILAAQQHGITTICLPEENREEVLKIKKEFNEDINLHFVKTMDEVLGIALNATPCKTKSKR